MDIYFDLLNETLAKKENEVFMNTSDDNYHSQMDSAAIDICGKTLAKLCSGKKRQSCGVLPNNYMDENANKLAKHIKKKYTMPASEEEIAQYIIEECNKHLQDGYYDDCPQ